MGSLLAIAGSLRMHLILYKSCYDNLEIIFQIRNKNNQIFNDSLEIISAKNDKDNFKL